MAFNSSGLNFGAVIFILYFEARDLQNLEIGQAICRIERADNDFNLSVPFSGSDLTEDAEAVREAAIDASRMIIDRYEQERDAFVEKLEDRSRKIGELENRLLQLDSPKN